MKGLKDFLECDFTTPASTLGMGSVTGPEETNVGSGDIPQCIDIKTGKLYKRRKKLKRYKMNDLKNVIQEKLKVNSNTKVDTSKENIVYKPNKNVAHIMYDALMQLDNNAAVYQTKIEPLINDLLKKKRFSLDTLENSDEIGDMCKAGLRLVSRTIPLADKEMMRKYVVSLILKHLTGYDYELTKEEEDYMVEWDYYNDGPHQLDW